MITAQDFEAANDRPSFILQAIREYMASEDYLTAQTAQKYYARKNPEISKRMSYLERSRKYTVDVHYHKLCSGFFRRLIMHQNGYLLGNGVSLEESAKEKLGGDSFDETLLLIGNDALVDGVGWGFWDHEKGLISFRATEFFALLDERTGSPMVGVRFYQIDPSKPLYFTVYERDGVTEYAVKDNGEPEVYKDKTPYQTTVGRSAATGDKEIILGVANYDILPIFPLYANELKQSEIIGLKGWIDAYDFVASDLIDSITLVDGLYSIVKNYGGDDLEQLVAEINEKKVIFEDDGDGGASSRHEVVESPYISKKEALAFLENRIVIDFMIPSQISGRAATATEINLAREPLDFKVDIFELQVSGFIRNILRLLGIDEKPKFKRRTTTNDTEITNAISTMREDLSLETALALYPYMPEDKIEENIKQLAIEQAALDAVIDDDPPDDPEGNE